jgi:antitoxin (DNA-binding transcriptional repressor) of toxin-antitoxin stability system
MSNGQAKPAKGEGTMSKIVTVEQAQATLKELIHQLTLGEEVIITENQQPVAKLVSEQLRSPSKQRPGPGLGKGMITFIAPDFDAPLEEMKEYME